MSKVANWYLFTDGASRGNPGPAGAGIYLRKEQESVIQQGYFLGSQTNNQAEYYALLFGLFYAKNYMGPADILHIRLDSELIVRQIEGRYGVKNNGLKDLYNAAKRLLPKQYTIGHVERAQNSIADKWANHGVDKKIKVPAELLAGLQL